MSNFCLWSCAVLSSVMIWAAWWKVMLSCPILSGMWVTGTSTLSLLVSLEWPWKTVLLFMFILFTVGPKGKNIGTWNTGLPSRSHEVLPKKEMKENHAMALQGLQWERTCGAGMLLVYTHVWACMHTHTHIHTHTHKHSCMHTYRHIHVYTQMYTYKHTRTFMLACRHVHVHTHTDIHTWRKNILCVVWMYHLSIKKSLWLIGKDRKEGGTFGRQKGFWDRARCGRFAKEDVMWQMRGTWAQ